ncbi:hypothetical protein [Burkholderia multivorans]|uniref:hypothetical protein n=1 Tax=Burkholderia multivorans TaxID=87883 RepID=UPI0021BE824B|nr:hypothetical protein [Burkholderia multivorans]
MGKALKYFLGFIVVAALFKVVVSVDNEGKQSNSQQAGQGVSSQSTSADTSLNPTEEAIKNTDFSFKWTEGGFGSIMMLDMTIKNNSKFRIKDLVVSCESKANSGTVIDHNKRTVYEAIEPGEQKFVKRFNMGFINSQASKTACGIDDLTVVQ